MGRDFDRLFDGTLHFDAGMVEQWLFTESMLGRSEAARAMPSQATHLVFCKECQAKIEAKIASVLTDGHLTAEMICRQLDESPSDLEEALVRLHIHSCAQCKKLEAEVLEAEYPGYYEAFESPEAKADKRTAREILEDLAAGKPPPYLQKEGN